MDMQRRRIRWERMEKKVESNGHAKKEDKVGENGYEE